MVAVQVLGRGKTKTMKFARMCAVSAKFDCVAQADAICQIRKSDISSTHAHIDVPCPQGAVDLAVPRDKMMRIKTAVTFFFCFTTIIFDFFLVFFFSYLLLSLRFIVSMNTFGLQSKVR